MSWYDDYLKRAQARRLQNMSMSGAKPIMQALNLENRQLKEQLEGQMLSGGNPHISSELLRQQASNAANKQSEQLFSNERSRMESENRLLDEGIYEAKAKLDEERKTERRNRKDGLLKAGLQAGGATLGAVVGSIVPGAGTMIGAQIGASLGSIGSGFVGGGGKISTNNADPEEIMMGLQDTISGISSVTTLNNQKRDLESLSKFMKHSIGSSSPEVQSKVKLLNLAIQSGNMDLIRNILEGF